VRGSCTSVALRTRRVQQPSTADAMVLCTDTVTGVAGARCHCHAALMCCAPDQCAGLQVKEAVSETVQSAKDSASQEASRVRERECVCVCVCVCACLAPATGMPHTHTLSWCLHMHHTHTHNAHCDRCRTSSARGTRTASALPLRVACLLDVAATGSDGQPCMLWCGASAAICAPSSCHVRTCAAARVMGAWRLVL
jgi:hypothetical protein